MSRAISLIVAAMLAALLTPVGRADAAYSMICTGYSSCSSKGYSNHNYSAKQGTSYWAMYTGTNCTNYVAYRLVTTNGMPNKRPKPGVGNARDWGTTMSSITNSTPTAGSVAWWGSKVGGNHVAYVEKVVSSSEIWVSESNWAGAFDWRKITKSGSGWPQGFIHFADPAGLKTMTATVKPAMKTAPVAGTEVEVSNGTWSPSGGTMSYRYQWLIDGTDIAGATTSTFTPTEEMVGRDLAVRVIASRSGYVTKYLRTEADEVLPTALTAVRPPTVTGDAREGRTLTATTGQWSPSTVSYSYRWIADGVAIPDATESTFVPGPEQISKKIMVQVAAKHPDLGLRTARSGYTDAVLPDQLTATVAPSIDGTLRVGESVTANPGTWSPSADGFSYRWIVGGTAVPGATGRTFDLTAAHAGKTVMVQVAAKRADYAMRTARSAAGATVAPGVIARGSRPVIKGTPRVGSRLTSSTGTWNPKGVTLRYRWIVGNDVVAGVTGSTFTPRRQDAGHTVTVLVTASYPGYADRESLAATRVTIPR